ncbi:MAG TPA: Bax inhibitor-1/YccA family protein [Vicinamibacterales bacterium]|nr:Bax inhibitor-1/YccA family protein [Vicinamibacterales bacterium]
MASEYTRSQAGYPAVLADQANEFLTQVYGWMCAGLGVTAVTAWLVAGSPTVVHALVTNRALFWVLAIAQLGIVLVLSARVQQLAVSAAAVLFIGYSVITGTTMSFVLLAYTGTSVAATFVIAAGMFAALAFYGISTKRSLDGLGQFLFMGLIGVVLATIVGVFWQNSAVEFAVSLIGVLVFSGLTAYDAQRLKTMALQSAYRGTTTTAVVGALSLYLDFANLFLFLLRFTGDRRSDY